MKDMKIEIDVTTGNHLSFNEFMEELFPKKKN
jgi:hypothetical protein